VTKTNVYIASSEEEASFISSLPKKTKRKYKIIATSYDAKALLDKLNVDSEILDPLKNGTAEKFIKNSLNISLALINDRQLDNIFSVNNSSILPLFLNRFQYYLLKILNADENLNLIARKNQRFNIVVKKTTRNGHLPPPVHHDFTSLIAPIWASFNDVKIKTISSKTHGAWTERSSKNKVLHFFIRFYDQITIMKISPKIIFVIPSDHAIQLVKIFKELEKSKVPYLAIIHNLTVYDWLKLKISKINFVNRDSFTDDADKRKIDSALNNLQIRWNKVKKNFKLFNGDKKQNLLLNDYAKLLLNQIVHYEMRSVINDMFIARHILNINYPRILITTTDPDPKVLTFIKYANSKHVKSITIQHGAYVQPSVVDFQSQTALIWGQYFKNWFIENLKKGGKELVITGSPFFDNLRIKKAVKTRNEKFVLLFLLSSEATESVYLFEELKNIFRKINSKEIEKVNIRPHPWQSIEESMLAVDKKSYSKINIAAKKNLLEYIEECDLVVTMNTTAGLVPLILGKPVIYWDFNKSEKLPFKKYSLPNATSQRELVDLIKKFMSGSSRISEEARKEILKSIFYKLDGKSSKRTVNYLKTLLD